MSHERVLHGTKSVPDYTSQATGFTTAVAYATITASAPADVAAIDTAVTGAVSLAFAFQNAGAANSADFRVQASVDGLNWTTLTIYEADGTTFSAADITVANSTTTNGFITPSLDSVQAAYRHYRVQARNASGGGNTTTVRAWIVAK